MLHFCPHCRNPEIGKSIVGTLDDRATAVCGSCERTFDFPYYPLFTLEGAPAVGKSTTAGYLAGNVELAIYEGDLHIDLTNQRLSWGSICALDFRICMTLHAQGQPALFVGGMHPHEPRESPEMRYFAGLERCALTCADDDLRERLNARPELNQDDLEWILDINRWYRDEGETEGIEIVNTSRADPPRVAETVTEWIDSKL